MRTVTVSSATNGASLGGVDWRVTFTSNVGDVPQLFADGSYLTTTTGDASIATIDGDNAVDASTGLKQHDTVIGETPASYGQAIVSADARTFTIANLSAGTEYFVYVSARNQFGVGPRASGGSLEPPQQKPQPPTDVSLAVDYGSAGSLTVGFAPPLSDGGADVTRYRVELDPTETFDAPVREDFECPSANKRAVWSVQTVSDGVIVGGSFVLQLSVNGETYDTDAIPYVAPATTADESGVEELISTIRVDASQTKPGSAKLGTDVQLLTLSAGTTSGVLFEGDRIKIEGSYHPEQMFVVSDVKSKSFNVTALDGTTRATFNGTEGTDLKVTRVYGGRGSSTTSRVYCVYAASTCASARVASSGSLESKLEALSDAIVEGVTVERVGPDADNGFEWRSRSSTTRPPSRTTTRSRSVAEPHRDQLVGRSAPGDRDAGRGRRELRAVHGASSCRRRARSSTTSTTTRACSRTTRSALAAADGLLAEARDGAGAAGVGHDRDGVVLELRVYFSPPRRRRRRRDGLPHRVGDRGRLLGRGQRDVLVPRRRRAVPAQDRGPHAGHVLLRARARGQLAGYGDAQVSTPSSLNPYEESSAPTGVALGVTSDTMLTVSFASPEDDGGDAVTAYLVEWDTMSHFNSLSASPHKGSVELDAAAFSSYTITLLSLNTLYYVRVAAVNAAGAGATMLAGSTYPALQVPAAAVDHGRDGRDGRRAQRAIAPARARARHPVLGHRRRPIDDCRSRSAGARRTPTAAARVRVRGRVQRERRVHGLGRRLRDDDRAAAHALALTSGRTYYARVLARNSVGSGAYCERGGVNCPDTGAVLVASAM